jgi:WD40 repeat protein
MGSFAESGVNSLAFTPDGRSLVGGGPGETAYVWDVAAGRKLRSLPEEKPDHHDTAFPGGVQVVGFDPEGRLLVCLTWSQVRIWDFATGTPAREIGDRQHQWHCGALSPDGQTLATGGEDGGIALWDVQTGEQKGSADAHHGGVVAVCFVGDGSRLASAGSDGTIKLWHLPSERLLATFWDIAAPAHWQAYPGGGEGLTQESSGLWAQWTPDGFYE